MPVTRRQQPTSGITVPDEIARDIEVVAAIDAHIVDLHAIRHALIIGTTPATQGGFLTIPLGMDAAKISHIGVKVKWNQGGWVPPGYTQNPGRQFTWDIPHTNTSVISIINAAGNSAEILDRLVHIYLSYIL